MDDKDAFAKRFNELCDDMGVPPKGENRQTKVGKLFGVSQKGARKWLEGEGFPTYRKLIAIAKWGEVNFEWLATGRGPKRSESSTLRPKLQDLVHAAEELPDYKVDQLIRIVPAIADDQAAGPHGESGRPNVDSGFKVSEPVSVEPKVHKRGKKGALR